ncbi:MAG TPA: hypothetical protein VGN57_00030 [Pirellulaceae bacterium]|jgi:hypothetical protein|nr:hypothetical protein [Pirellulaceae bacterium]
MAESAELKRIRFALCWVRASVGLTLGLAMFPATIRVFESLVHRHR